MSEMTYSPVIAEPTAEMVAALAVADQVPVETALVHLVEERELAIRRMTDEPAIYGWVSPIWRVCWALLGVPWLDAAWAKRMREALTFDRPVRSLLILGGQRSGKTQFEATSGMKLLLSKEKARFWMFHMTHEQSVRYHQALMWQMIPTGWRRKIKTEREYISWTEQRGFSDDNFILATGSNGNFRNYSQDVRDAIEGGEVDGAAADELIPADWVETLEFRLATRNGWLIVGFTPVDGYSGTVKMFCDGATVVKESTAFLLPRDGKEPDEARALGLTPDEYAEVKQALIEERMPACPPCRPQQCEKWLDGETGEPQVPAGRVFEKMPRVLKCAGRNAAVVYFHSPDNPWGNAANVIEKSRAMRVDERRIRFYGFAERLVGARFHTFDDRVHVVKADSIPQHGTNYMIVDPCSGRAFFMLWIRITPDGKWFVFREWPGNYNIPGIGVPEPWAEPSSGKEMDGKKGRGQKSPGWGLAGYKREIARLEGWQQEGKTEDGRRKLELWVNVPRPDGMSEEDWVASWSERGMAKEKLQARYMDARFANTKSFEEGGMVTLIEKFEEIGLTFYDSSTGGGKWTIDDGCSMIEDALAYDNTRPVDFFNEPRVYISEDCRNLIFAMKTWTGEDGQTGATKDPIDCLRMGFLKGLTYVDPVAHGMIAGRGCY
jgi:hypothetical protein